jgi:hypothetical protein
MKKVCWVLLSVMGMVLHAQSLDDYLKAQCDEVGLPARVAYAILAQENEVRKSDAVHLNKNGSMDLGLWQLNDRYLYTDFISRYWDRLESFRWYDPYHSTYIAVRHIKWLWDRCPSGVPLQSKTFTVALAYNCGSGALKAGRVPADSVDYAERVVAFVWGGL